MNLHTPLGQAAACLALGLAGHAFAHDAWIEPRDGAYVVLYGHGDKVEGYAAEKVKTLAAFDAAGAPLAVSRQPAADGLRVSVTGSPALLTLHFDNGIWTKTTDGSKNLPKREVPGALSASHSLKYAKTVLAWTPVAARPQGQALELLPLTAQAPAAGSTLPLQVLWQGKPLAGAKVIVPALGKEQPLEADAAGKVQVPVTAGKQMVSVSHKLTLQGDPEADSEAYAANLVFTAR